MKHTVYLSMGSNMGDRMHYLNRALSALTETGHVMLMKQSAFYETSPVGGVVQDDFINLAAKISTDLSADALLDLIHQVEQKLNRVRLIHWGPRTIDIDILFFDEEQRNDDKLTIPHAEVFNRLFVLVPLLDVVDADFYALKQLQNAQQKLQDSEQALVKIEN
ncbi:MULTISPECIES: 2-amino-4-hydroxy-6-hydroxymethyldihydropteridine diphosphokinase [unclassified Lactococcus]|uniref:2-amino-4-hydroxy-6- hydroxymethyldihydropteridine diphosphokinase n=1 Tax=unclassified Lactococcus TaxID=2643510 RepID=UPI0011CB6514|nr:MULTISPECIES: 2-amino-4-hydroxy-6-hydroxymethyldihydropteridine diphosphokinase [unclassified Lactococcus]MQW23663.1 2-amino-4-hydroxy-6-hydroxymethyldihydropteridine diphosphokinase [Lactococcus sp. dk101]TXK37604.1 2-amino-4-hydroxy-6-hydroxymethyldihydropteridine diphosphokinase [Lactococcus sp. dk310]TXK49042.1 2-amino-4-hydroxy-6-hydroxymethyldihydropteridine diphosphokinase [Lactococcus sp. dk322]